MKKLLIVLMIVAMASFLFVGCFGTTPDIPDEDEEEPGPVIPATEAPIITEISGVSFTSALAQYTNKIEVSGIAPIGSVIRIYVDGVNTGMGYVGTGGLFKGISGTKLVKVLDGAKTLYATATEFGLAESAPSASYSFTYDTTAPKILKAVADAGKKFITVTFDEAVNTSLSDTTSTTLTWAKSAVNPANWTITHTGFTATDYLAISNKVIRITGTGLTVGTFVTSCTGISDLLGNAIKATAPSTYIGVVIPAAPVVPDPNLPPEITSAAITSGTVGIAYTYDVDATDPDEDDLTYSLTAKPAGMAIVATTGLISWTPNAAGFFVVGVKVEDPDELFDVQSFVITVTEPEPEPVASTPPTILGIEDPSHTPIVDIESTDTEYINEAEAGIVIQVYGIAGPEALVKVYIGSATTPVAAGEAGATGFFLVVVSSSSLGVDGAKTLYTTATEAGSEESASSNVVKFTLDRVAPKAIELKATAETAVVAGRATVLYSEPVTFATCALGVFTGIDWDTGSAHLTTPVAETYVAHIGSTTYYTLTSDPDLDVSDTVKFVVNSTIDLAGNTQITASALTCTVGAASATLLAP